MTGPGCTVELLHTADLPRSTRLAARVLLDDVFADEMTDEDWDHCLGGLHALAWEGDALVGHAAVVQRQLGHAGRAWRTGYVEGVAVRADRRRRGYGSALLDPIERVIRSAYELGALGSSDEGVPLYTARGWTPWLGPTWAITPDGRRRTATDDGAVFVLDPPAGFDVGGELTCDWRAGDLW